MDMNTLATRIRQWGRELGFQEIGIADTDLGEAEAQLQRWLRQKYHGDMEWMAAHGHKRSRPEELEPGTLRVICARMDYLPGERMPEEEALGRPERAYISRYALGRDYHKLVRRRLARLAARIREAVPQTSVARALVDSAPVMEKPLAARAGLGWQGKHTLLLNRHAGSWFFLGEIYTDLPLPVDAPVTDHCGSCTRCMEVCPTGAITAPYELDARKCISYLTIEHRGSIPEALRPLMGNRVFGCDDCQLFCPWNRYADFTDEPDFHPRHGLDQARLAELFLWSREQFLRNTEGSPLRRTGHEGWLRNLAIGLGNGPATREAMEALRARADHESALVREHVDWALRRLEQKATDTTAR